MFSHMQKFWFLILFAAAVSSSAHAESGFFDLTDATPAVVARAWPAVFSYIGPQDDGMTSMGSFSFVGTKTENGQTYAYFLGNDHVIDGSCLNVGKPCNTGSILVQDMQIIPPRDERPNAKIKKRPFSHFGTISGLAFRNPELVRDSKNPDLALLRAKVDKTMVLPKPIEIARMCNFIRPGTNTYAIGFPDLMKRQMWESPIPANAKILHKRWSDGVILRGLIYASDMGPVVAMITSTDLLPGSSGGPILDNTGFQVGVAVAMPKTATYQYVSNDEGHGKVVPCEYLWPFVSEALMTF